MKIKTSKIVFEEKEINVKPLKLNKNSNIFKFVTALMGGNNSPSEYLITIALDENAKPVSLQIMGNSAEEEVTFTMSSILRFVILSGQSDFIMIHNHPNDDTNFSKDDIETAKEIKKQASILGLNLVGDYLIAAGKCIKNKKL